MLSTLLPYTLDPLVLKLLVLLFVVVVVIILCDCQGLSSLLSDRYDKYSS